MFAAIASLPLSAGKLYDPVTDLPAANRAGAALFDFNHTASQTITDGKVAQVNDRLGNGFYATQLTADYRPASTANGIGSLTAAYFDGSNDLLDATASMANVSSGAQGVSVFATANNAGGDSVRNVVMLRKTNNYPRLAMRYSSSNVGAYGEQNDSLTEKAVAVNNASAVIVSAVNNATAGSLIVSGNGVTQSTAFSGSGYLSSSALTGVFIGALTVISQRLQGHIADLLVTPSILADLDRIDYEGWQAQRGSNLAANLPATHRHRYQRPRCRTPK